LQDKLNNKNMTPTKTPIRFFYASITVISILIFISSCVKQTAPSNTDPTKPNPPTSPASSNIIYTDLNPDSSILLATDSFNLDVNNDGITDFTFNKYLSSTECRSAVQEKFAFNIHLSIKPATANNAIMASASNLALALDADSGTIIGPDSLWATTSEILLEGAAISSCTLVTGHAGYWLNVSDKYLGLKFNAGNKTYYGWARLSSSYSVSSASHLIVGGQLIIKDFAYNSVPDQLILAGQTK
jgi:hypothetical protein